MTAIGTIGETLVAAGVTEDGVGLAWLSSDGSDWTRTAAPGGVIHDLATIPTGLVAAGTDRDSPTIWLTSEGVTWTPRTLGPTGEALRVAAAPDGSMVVAGVMTDTGATTRPWYGPPPTAPTGRRVRCPDLPPGRWAVRALGLTPTGYVLLLSDPGQGGPVGHIWSSPDGASWRETLVDAAGPLTAVGTAGTDALVIGHGQVLRSADGATWASTDEPSFEGWVVRDLITLADGRLVAVGDAAGRAPGLGDGRVDRLPRGVHG